MPLTSSAIHDPRLENAGATPVLLHAKLTRSLPWLVFEAEEDDLSTSSRLDPLECGSLVLGAGAGNAVAVTGVRPSRLEDVHRLAGAHAVQDVDFGLNEAASLVCGDIGIEESVQVGTDNVDDAAECRSAAAVLPDRKRLRGGDQASVAGVLERRGTARDEACEFAGRGVAIEDALVTNNNQLNQVPLSPGDNVGHLTLGARDTSRRDPDAQNKLQAVLASRAANVLEGVAVSAVHTDRRETLLGNNSQVGGDGACILATTLGCVRRVGHAPRISVGTDGTRAAAGRARTAART